MKTKVYEVVGPKGCGKTLAARGIFHRADIPNYSLWNVAEPALEQIFSGYTRQKGVLIDEVTSGLTAQELPFVRDIIDNQQVTINRKGQEPYTMAAPEVVVIVRTNSGQRLIVREVK